MSDVSMVVPIAVLTLAVVPGLHFDLMRVRRERARGNGPPQLARVVVAGTLITTGTLIVLGVLGQGSLLSLRHLLGESDGTVRSPLVTAWSAACFITVSLTMSSLAAVVLTRLENRPGPFPAMTHPLPRPAAVLRADYSDRDIELEITLNSGETFRGMLGDESAARGQDVRFLTLSGPIFQLDGHGKPLPLDALHWDQMVVPTRAVNSVLVRPVEEQPPPPTAFRGVPSRHATPRLRPSDQVKIVIERCYERRLAPRALAKLLVLQFVLIAIVGALSSALS